MRYLISQFELQTRLFNNVTSGIKDQDSLKQITSDMNHVAWLTGHLVSTRYMLAGVLGLQVKEPHPALFENGKGIQKGETYPSMNELTKDWAQLSEKITQVLKGLSQEALNNKMPRPVPTGDTLGDFITFIIHHEGYTIGQVGLYRRFLGYDAMKYN